MPPRVLLLATKDTMAYARRPPGVATGAELLAAVPADLLAAEVTVEDVSSEPSWDITPATMFALARRVRAALADDGYDGVVLTHGLDTLEETAYLIDLVVGEAADRGRIVLTGATRYRDELSADGPRNLASALTAAADPALAGAGVLVCLDDELHAARRVSMVDATGIAAVTSAPYPPVGRVVGGRVESLAAPPQRPPRAVGEPESDVALIKTYPGIDPVLLTAAVDAGARGVVLEGTGAGNVPASLLVTISDLTEWDIPVVVASRCRTRPVDLAEQSLGGEIAAKVGAIGARGLAPGKARCALMVALGHIGGVRVARDWFARL
ncbi:asparaginase [Solwaraspora sp. WMMD1047]|uniref:asparaginase n=1 Tax=Solwaraspora sp. WMMD1047 TaxID=3016102 RepID=UPI002416168B|nr:asparaginase [Solwaraspora sp. WMMD1047]MDG4832088.1 asparaginase [Solwaraspora sp. WMMD1047]